jgi:hypothetical protein
MVLLENSSLVNRCRKLEVSGMYTGEEMEEVWVVVFDFRTFPNTEIPSNLRGLKPSAETER